MAVLLHGTTRQRAERIIVEGPDPDFVEPGGASIRVGGFSAYVEHGPYLLEPPEKYARGKAAAFPNEGGPVIPALDISEDIISLAIDEGFFPLRQGLVQFDVGAGLEELLAAWSTISKQIREVES